MHLQHKLPPGTVAAAAGTVNAATDNFEITEFRSCGADDFALELVAPGQRGGRPGRG